ncbi:thiamine-phosphate kinase [Myxococcota bacterium]|nr:thiamine-phosphate kinase [Myxococcota bacterium]
MTTLKEVGEFGLIERIKRLCEAPWASRPRADLPLGIGDDAAIWRPTFGEDAVLTCDVQVMGRHFFPQMLERADLSACLGRRCAAVNLSDIAAMGAQPRLALVSLGLTEKIAVETVEALYRGLVEAFTETGVQIVGGNLTSTEGPLFVDITLIGQAKAAQLVRRSGAQLGDSIGLIGACGASAAGLAILQAFSPQDWQALELATCHPLVRSYLQPAVFLAAGRVLSLYAHAMIDVSDGLLADLDHLLKASGVGARLVETQIPCSDTLKRWSIEQKRGLLETLFAPSDDYSLLFCAASDQKQAIAEALHQEAGVSVSWIGEITRAQDGYLLERTDTSLQAVSPQGWKHF